MPTEAFIALLIEALAKTMPAGTGVADREACLSTARVLLDAYRPADAKEAALAARAIAAHFAAMDSFCSGGKTRHQRRHRHPAAWQRHRRLEAVRRADPPAPAAAAAGCGRNRSTFDGRDRRPRHAGVARAASGGTAAAGHCRRGDTARRHRPVAGSPDGSRARVVAVLP